MPKPPYDRTSSDGCSVPKALRELFPLFREGAELETPEQREGCVNHDQAYYCQDWPLGGTRRDRLIADLKLALWMAEHNMNVDRVIQYFVGVRDFGKPHWNNGGGRYSDEAPEEPVIDTLMAAGQVWKEPEEA
jgi:hypothetical protein